MFVVFEGIDGSGKTTLSNRVAQQLRDAGLSVEHVREGGNFASKVTQAMRELGRDSRNLALTPRAELLLYLAREVQLAEEATRPALGRSDVVIADRYVYTAEALALFGRGLPRDEVSPQVVAAMHGLVPDLVILVDVDPAIARARRRVSKLLARDEKPPSRKGLTGTGLQHRLRKGYRELAEQDPGRWLVIDNTDADLDEQTARLTHFIRAARDTSAAVARAQLRASHTAAPLAAEDVASAEPALLAWIDRRAAREPALAAWLLDGVPGPEAARRRTALADAAPVVVAEGLKWLSDAPSWLLREQLVDRAPGEVARSLVGEAALQPGAQPLFERLVERVPRDVASALWGRDDAQAWALRERLTGSEAARSVGGVTSERAWTFREAWLRSLGGLDAIADPITAKLVCEMCTGVGDDRAWKIRKAMRDRAPVAAIEATQGLVDDRAWRWREKTFARAPKTVMRSLLGLDDPRAWAMREQVVRDSEEALDSIIGMHQPRAWALRETGVEDWPATAIKSLGALGATPRGRALAERALRGNPHDVGVWRQVVIRTAQH